MLLYLRNVTNYITRICIRYLSTNQITFAGHSKWANIKHTKSKKDTERSLIFTRLSRQIRLAIEECGGVTNLELNPKLRNVVENAIKKNMPMATIQKTMSKFHQTEKACRQFELGFRYNKNITAIISINTEHFAGTKMDISTVFRKFGAQYSDVNHLFTKRGVIKAAIIPFHSSKCYEDRVLEDAIECGAEEFTIVNNEIGLINFFCSSTQLDRIRRCIEAKGYKVQQVQNIYIALSIVNLKDQDKNSYLRFIEQLLKISGVQEIYDNVKT